MNVIKASGEKEKFDRRKIEKTAMSAGASKQFAREVSNRVERRIHEGITTKEILKITLELLKEKPEIASRYDLKRAIMNLGPSGFPFEKFFAAILRNYGYETKVGATMAGKAVTHEVDIIAKKDKRYMVECKYHNQPGTHTDSKVAMYTYARFLDLKNNPENKIDSGWLATNTKCTPHAIQYAKGVGLRITSWQYASGNDKNLQELIAEKKLYPVTILKSINRIIKERLSQAGIVLARELTDSNLEELKIKTNLPESILTKIIREAQTVCSC